ncbi:MAG: hypothetical protein DCC75_14145 [Proteobacteria bacterium]|nr:MAG: hypothetical protein DCC75_14145 [Pseudomonadota bacterium]
MPKTLNYRSKISRASRGVTLMELLVAMLILSVLGSIALPKLNDMKASFDRRDAKQKLEFDLRRARAEALSKGVRVVITLSSDLQSYTVGEDLLAYDTTNGNHDTLLFTTVLPQNVTLSFSGSGPDQTKLIFTSRGFLSDIIGNRNTSQRTITLSYQGSSFSTATIYPVGVASFGS